MPPKPIVPKKPQPVETNEELKLRFDYNKLKNPTGGGRVPKQPASTTGSGGTRG